MADENKFLHLGNSNDKILYDKFKGKLEKKDIATNNKLLQIFNFFDKDGNGIIETANSKGVNEMQSLWNAVRTSATKNSNSIFEDSEAQELLKNSVDSTGKSLADNQVTASDLFAFLKALITPQTKQANSVKLEDLKPEDIVEYTPEEIEDISIQTVTDGVKQAREVFDAQKAQQGAVSDFVNETKETFDTEYASSRVDRYLMNEELCAQLLQRAKEDGLSEKEYLEAKIDLAMKLIQSLEKYSLRTEVTKDAINISLSFLTLGIADQKETKNSRELKAQKLELENLKTLLAKLSPEEINMLISKLLFIEENPKGNSNFDFSFGGKNNKAKPQTVTRYGVEGEYLHISPEEYEGEAAPNSLESLSKPYAIYKKMTFEEVFEKERGVQYNPEAIMDYSTKEAQLQFLVGMHNRNEAIKNILHDATVAVDGNNKYGAPQHDAIETCNQNLENSLNLAFKNLYSQNTAEAIKVINEILGENSGVEIETDEQGNFSNIKFTQNGLSPYTMVNLSEGLQQKLKEIYQTALNGKTLDDYSAEVKSAYQMAYGAENAEDMASAFVQSQQEGVQNTKAVVQGLGMVVMVAGQLIPVGGQVASALIVGSGTLISTFGGVGVSYAENSTKAGGPTEEDKKAMLQELGTSLALVGSGMGIGKGSEAIFRTLVMKNCPKLIAFAAEVGVDTTASLLADYAITGQIDLTGEGIAQLQNILVGIIGARGSKNYLNSHAGDLTVKPNKQNSIKLGTSVYDAKYALPPYNKLTPAQLKVIKYIDMQKRKGIDVNVTNAIKDRIDNSAPPNLFKYLENIDSSEALEKFIKDHTIQETTKFRNKNMEMETSTYDMVEIDGKTWCTPEIARSQLENMLALKKFLDTQSTPETINVTRAEGVEVMNNIKIGNKTIAEIMKEIGVDGKPDKLLEILNSEDIVVTYDNFVGTSLLTREQRFSNSDGNISSDKAALFWDITVPKGSKGAFIENLTSENIMSEMEFLLQAGSQLKITGAEFKDGVWYLKGELIGVKNLNVSDSSFNTLKGITSEEDALIQKAITENSTEVGGVIKNDVNDIKINIPKGKLGAPIASFLETDESFRNIVIRRASDIAELDKIKNVDEFLEKGFQIIKEEMGLADSPIKLEITDDINQYDLITNTVTINRKWAKGDKAELFGAIVHELNHFLQWKEVILNYDQDSEYWVKLVSYLQKTENGQANIEYIMNKYPDNIELQEFFDKAKSYEENWQKYITPEEPETGKVDVTSERYRQYKGQTVEEESFRRGDIVAEEYRKAVRTETSVSNNKNDNGSDLDFSLLINATKEKPQKVILLGQEVNVVDYIKSANVLVTDDFTRIKLDKFYRPVEIETGWTTKKCYYDSDIAKEASLIEEFGYTEKIICVTKNDEKQTTVLDYDAGTITVTNKNTGELEVRNLMIEEYPKNVSSSSKLYKNIISEVMNCKSVDEVFKTVDFYMSKGYSVADYYFKDKIKSLLIEDFELCKTVEELCQKKNLYDSTKIDFLDSVYQEHLKILLKREIKNCNKLDDLILFKESYLKKKVEIEDGIYIEQRDKILCREIKNCKSIDDLYNFKNNYAEQGVNLPEIIFNNQLYEIIYFELKSCKTKKDLDDLQIKYKEKGIVIPENIFEYISREITSPRLTDIEQRIKDGNEKTFDRFQDREFNLKDPKYVTDIPRVCEELQARLETDMGVLSSEQISSLARSVSLKKQIPEQEVLEIMSRLTQFGSFRCLKDFSSKLNELDISGFYNSNISTNSALNYLIAKKQIVLNGTTGKAGFILDDAGLKYLESLSVGARKRFYNNVKEGSIVLLELDGTNFKIGDNYYSYTMLDGGQNLAAMTEAVVEQMQSGKTLDEVLQSDLFQRLNKIFEPVEENNSFNSDFVNTISLKKDVTPENISLQVKPNMPDADYIQKVISTVVEKTTGLTETEKSIATSVIAKYYDFMLKCFSPDSYGEILKTTQRRIEQQVIQLGKTMDDVVYICPSKGKSFDLVCLQYAKVNGIDPASFKFYNGNSNNLELSGKILVLLDDVVGSGLSMIRDVFDYRHFRELLEESSIIFAPITCAEAGKHNITNAINEESRIGKDFLLFDETLSSNYEEFTEALTPEELRVLDKIIGHKGFKDGGLVTGFQYMTPDNNSSLSGYLNLINLNNPSCKEANKPIARRQYDMSVHEELVDYIQKRE